MIITTLARQAALEALGYPNNPFVAWENIGAGGTLGGTAVLTDGDRANAFSGSTYDYWLPDVAGTTAYLSTQITSQTIGFVGIAAHNLADLSATVAIENSADGSTWADAGAGDHVPASNDPIAFRLPISGNSAPYWRIAVTGLTASDPLYIGVAFFGTELVFPRRFYQGFAPALGATEVQLQSSVSEGGNLVGSSVIRQGQTLQAELGNIAPTFIRGTDFRGFMDHYNAGKPSFFGWRPEKYSGDLHYTWRAGGTLRPENTGPNELMGFKLQMRGFYG